MDKKDEKKDEDVEESDIDVEGGISGCCGAPVRNGLCTDRLCGEHVC